ncbi:aconitate hydratase [Dechloromonas sp. XY25]|uniref:Aconitate hydratase n=1 Tax=Dechloromonas hankyongensis TaxID=2908002 RepID=A0ABS9K2W4_9RHOO|nr:aconitate hydratase [Dechloromonas hankyongensis]MCG2577476.1 aconitate hydratase [Dechloromonas hankyongensis]
MARNLARKLIESHLVSGRMVAGEPIELAIDQTLAQDATGTVVMLECEALGITRVKTQLSAQYVDHNLIEADFRNPDDHLFLQSACRRFGVWYSPAGNGVSHPVHMEAFGIPGKTLLGADSHTCAAGSLGMLAIGAGGLQVALAMAGEPFALTMPAIMGVRLSGVLPPWVSAKDVILEMLRRHSVKGGVGRIIEYHGPGLAGLSAMDRHVIANMGQELGATASVFPADAAVQHFLAQQGRAADFVPLTAEPDAGYDEVDAIDLSTLEPLIALPSSPDKVVPVRQVAGRPLYQAYIGSSANPGLRDFEVPARMLAGRRIAPGVSFEVNPTSRQTLENLIASGALMRLVEAGARLHQTGCNGCIGMGQAPATGRISLRTVPRNFPGRSGTEPDQVYLCSPETATASALTGEITDPRDLDIPVPRYEEPVRIIINRNLLQAPTQGGEAVELVRGPNIKPLPEFPIPGEHLEGPVLLKMGDNVSTDEILPAGVAVLPLRSNIPEISKHAFQRIDPDFYERAIANRPGVGFVIGGSNYGQGSSREHAAMAPAFLGVRCVIAKSFARIHRRNLINFGIIPLLFARDEDAAAIAPGDVLHIDAPLKQLASGQAVCLDDLSTQGRFLLRQDITAEELTSLQAGGLINRVRQKLLTGARP